MVKIAGYMDIPLGDLVIGKAASRTEDPAVDIEALAASIQSHGLLQPIVVCPARESGKWEILTGQRRFLAHRLLKKESIAAAILDRRVEGAEAKAISITENLVRHSPSIGELLGGAAFLDNRGGSIKEAAAAAADLPVEAVKVTKSKSKATPPTAAMTENMQAAVQRLAEGQNIGPEETTVKLIEEVLAGQGFLEEWRARPLGLSSLELGRLRLSVGYGTHKKGRPLSPIKVGLLFRQARRAGFSLEDCAKAVNLTGTTQIVRFLRILDLPQDIQHWIDWGQSKGAIGFSAAAELVRLRDENDRRAVAEAVLSNGLGKIEVRQIVQLRKGSKRTVSECLQKVLARRAARQSGIGN